jgi:hypothetical protein
MRSETYDKEGLAERATVTRDAGVPTFRLYRRPDFTTPALTRAATPDETAVLEAEEQETARANAWASFKAETAKANPDLKTIATLMQALLDRVMQ